MLINVVEPEEARIAVLEDDSLEELYVERSSSSTLLGNIYKGRVVSIEPSIQAAFVDFGIDKNGFLHVSDVMPAYGKLLEDEAAAGVATPEPRRRAGRTASRRTAGTRASAATSRACSARGRRCSSR